MHLRSHPDRSQSRKGAGVAAPVAPGPGHAPPQQATTLLQQGGQQQALLGQWAGLSTGHFRATGAALKAKSSGRRSRCPGLGQTHRQGSLPEFCRLFTEMPLGGTSNLEQRGPLTSPPHFFLKRPPLSSLPRAPTSGPLPPEGAGEAVAWLMRRASSSPQAAGAGHRAGGHWAQSPAPGPWRRGQ